jgi:hypothetical protein
MRRTLCVVALILLPRITRGQEPTPPPLQELFFTEVVYPQEQGETQLTLGSLVDRSRSDLSALMPFTIEYGLTDRWQIEAGWDGYTHFHSAPFRRLRTARLSLGTKYSLMNIAHSRVHAAFGAEVEFPHAGAFAESEGEQGVEVEPFVALAANLVRRVTVIGSAGASFEPREVAEIVEGAERPDDRGTMSAGALLAYRRATVAAEWTNRSDELPWRLDGAPLVTPSIVIHLRGHWEMAAGMPVALRRAQHRPGVAMHIVKEF